MAYKDNYSFYLKSFQKHGRISRGLRWNNQKTQYIRFGILIDFIKENLENSSITDAGCGFGDLYSYLLKNNLKCKKYIGIDCEEFMIKEAKKSFCDIQFYKKNIILDPLIKTDYYLCSGAMNILDESEIILFINKCFEASNKGFIFNFYKKLNFNDIDENDILRHCSTISDKLCITKEYLDNDFTIYMGK